MHTTIVETANALFGATGALIALVLGVRIAGVVILKFLGAFKFTE
jgi:hypothetical protein